MFCKGGNGTCLELVGDDAGYCEEHGGKERYEQELEALRPMRAEQDGCNKPRKFVPEKPKGQSVPHGEGLSRFTSEETREIKRATNHKKRAAREADRKATRLARGPKKQKKGGGKKKGDDGDKKGKKNKLDKNARKAARNGAVPTAQPPAANSPAPEKTP